MKKQALQSNTENNTLSIIDNPITQDKIITNNKINNNNENIPIKELRNTNIKSPEDYYSLYYPEYKLIKICGFLFCKIGNIIAFNFDKNNNFTPKLSIGPHWYMTLILNLIIISLGSTLYVLIIKNMYFLFSIGFIILFFIAIIMVDRAALIHPGIAMNKISDYNNYSFCNICKIYYNPDEKVGHCSLCKVCIKNLDHHCVWVGKCVGKNNLKSFYEMIVAFAIFYLYIIICVIIFAFRKDKEL